MNDPMMPGRMEDSTRQSDAAFAMLKAEIIACRLAPGSTFSEAALSVRFGLAKAASRSALTRLSELRLVLAVARHGYTVAPVTVQSIRELFEVRLIAEPKAAALAAGRVNVAELRRLNRAPQRAHSDVERLAFVAANRDFHRAIAAATGNARLYALLETLADEGERLVHLGLFGPGAGEKDRAAADQGHEALIAALEASDPVAAERAAAAHVEHARDIALARIMSGPSSIPIR
ncbi:GntR family transcriptional regulator [Caulobacter henricii]|nr:GntR family transcriptional regulator [Caulobacter henricii]